MKAEICRLDSKDCLKKAADIISKGRILVYPTDTLYGLGVDARNDVAVDYLSQLKGRNGPWSIIVADLNMLKKYAQIPVEREKFIRDQLPGKVTFILSAKASDLSHRIVSKKGTVGIRIPGHSFPVNLVQHLQYPITTTSVNRTGEEPLNNPQLIFEIFGNNVDLIVDDGTLPPSKGSRIIDLTKDEIKIIRDTNEK